VTWKHTNPAALTCGVRMSRLRGAVVAIAGALIGSQRISNV